MRALNKVSMGDPKQTVPEREQKSQMRSISREEVCPLETKLYANKQKKNLLKSSALSEHLRSPIEFEQIEWFMFI